ncbi:TPA: hypothetical protein OMH15_004618, partial [Escherichia coli]|nr:hypothetical protein [Escherichia coli]
PSFNNELRNFYLRNNATLYEVYHEVIHAKQFAKIFLSEVLMHHLI